MHLAIHFWVISMLNAWGFTGFPVALRYLYRIPFLNNLKASGLKEVGIKLGLPSLPSSVSL
jgi:hypothetical protein